MNIKRMLKLSVYVFGLLICASCKKDKTTSSVPDTLSSKDFIFNTANKQITPDPEIGAELSSPTGIQLIYAYLVRNNTTDSLIYIGTPTAAQQHQYPFSIPAANYAQAKMQQVKGIRILVKHLDNSSFEGMIKVTAFTPPLPKLENVPATLLPDGSGKITLTGKASSENGLKQISIYDDYQGTFALVAQIPITGSPKSQDINYAYTYRKNAANLKVVITDNFDLTAEASIKIPLKAFNFYQDITMMANGTAAAPSTNSFFVGETGTTLGSCNISGQESKVDFLGYCTSTSIYTIYTPTNTSTIAKNYKCGTLIWEPNTADLKATRFRVLIPGTADADRIYAAYTANTITELNDDFFGSIAVPGSSTAKFDPIVANQAAAVFNLTQAYLIWIRVPKADGTFTNQLMRAKEVNIASTAALSTMKFDIMVSK
jgi:hypothetical protein